MKRRAAGFSGRALAAVAAAAITLAAAPARANPLDTFGFGSRETAMAGAVSAEVKDATANYYNPAGLARAHGIEVMIGYFRADHALKMNGQDNHVDPVKGLDVGAVAPGELFGVPFAFGLGLHLPDDRISRVRALRQEQPRWALYDNRNQQLYFASNVAVSPFRWLQLGVGLSFFAATRGDIEISGDANIFQPEKSQLRHEVDADLTAVRYPQAGARIALGDRAALAVVYRGQFKMDIDLRARLVGDLSQLTTAYLDIEAKTVNAFLPQQVVVGGSWDLARDLRAGLDLTWVNWAAYEAPVADLDVTLDIPPPKGGWPAGITPPSTPARARIVPLKLRDRVVPHLGVEWRAFKVKNWAAFVRGGYEYAKSPIVVQSGPTNYVDRDRHSVSFGVGGKVASPLPELPGDVRLDAHAQLSMLPETATRKDDPADLVGDYTAGGTILNLGATLTVGF